jgi:hypothetical protein
MLESGSSGSVRGVPSNGHPYRDPGPIPESSTNRYRMNVIGRNRPHARALRVPGSVSSRNTGSIKRPAHLRSGTMSSAPGTRVERPGYGSWRAK